MRKLTGAILGKNITKNTNLSYLFYNSYEWIKEFNIETKITNKIFKYDFLVITSPFKDKLIKTYGEKYIGINLLFPKLNKYFNTDIIALKQIIRQFLLLDENIKTISVIGRGVIAQNSLLILNELKGLLKRNFRVLHNTVTADFIVYASKPKEKYIEQINARYLYDVNYPSIFKSHINRYKLFIDGYTHWHIQHNEQVKLIKDLLLK